MNSHIQMPKKILKKFVNEQNFYYKYDAKTHDINKGFPKSTYTQEGYYSDNIETFFNQSVETHLNKLYNYIKGIEEKELPITLDNYIINIAKNYILLLLIRSEIFHNLISNGSLFSEILNEQEQHDTIIIHAIRNKTINQFIDDLEISFIYNKTKVPFVLPTRGLYQFNYKGIPCFNIPIDPYFSVWARMPNKIITEVNDGLLVINNPQCDIVNDLNFIAVREQVKDGVGYIVSHNEELLKTLKNDYNAFSKKL